MGDETLSPTLEQFLATTRAEFSFLPDYGFHEILLEGTRSINPYEVQYRRGGWRLRIEGLSYGFSADLTVIAPDGLAVSFGHIVPESFLRTAREGLGRGQLGEVRFCAVCLKTFGLALLKGDYAIVDELHRRAQLVAEHARDGSRQRDMESAIARAADAFRAGRYADVIALLSPFESSLPRAQAAKLELARRRSPGEASSIP